VARGGRAAERGLKPPRLSATPTSCFPATGMYFGVLAVGLIGALIARFRPRRRARPLFVMALAQALVPVIALIIGTPDFAPGVVQVFCVNAVFVMLFVGSAMLFRRNRRSQDGVHLSPLCDRRRGDATRGSGAPRCLDGCPCDGEGYSYCASSSKSTTGPRPG
jgi:hypothetical protein